jgi:hypothetical protein
MMAPEVTEWYVAVSRSPKVLHSVMPRTEMRPMPLCLLKSINPYLLVPSNAA